MSDQNAIDQQAYCTPVSLGSSKTEPLGGDWGKPSPVTLSGTVGNCNGDCMVSLTWVDAANGTSGSAGNPPVDQTTGSYTTMWTPPQTKQTYTVTATTNTGATNHTTVNS